MPRARQNPPVAAAVAADEAETAPATAASPSPEEADGASDAGASPSTPAKNPATKPKKLTPAMQQHDRFKRAHPGCVLFFRMGDFYELFDDDAVLCSRVLGLTLTKRGNDQPMAGVPHHSVDGYLRRMIEAGYRVAIADQVQDPKDAKGVVDRAVTRVLTPGTLVDESLLDEARPNLVASVIFGSGPLDDPAIAVTATIAAAEVSTGQFTVMTVPAPRLADELARLGASEVIVAERDGQPVAPALDAARAGLGFALTPRGGWTFRAEEAARCLHEHFRVSTLEGYGLEAGSAAVCAAGALVRYLRDTQDPDAGDAATGPGRLAHLEPPRRLDPARGLVMDAASLASLEVERTVRSGRADGTLLHTMQNGVTPMGRRLLRDWLCYPLADLDAITARQDIVAALHEDERLRRELTSAIKPVQDVARIAGRIAMRRATPRDVVSLGTSAGRVAELRDLCARVPALADVHGTLQRLAADLEPLAADILTRCNDEPPAHLRDGGLFRDGCDAELDEARGLQRDASTWLAAYQADLIAESEIPSLKVGFNRVFGYYIEITNAHRDRVPESFHRKQTLKNAERYITPELKTFEEKVLTAEDRARAREQQLFDALCTGAAAHAGSLATYAHVVAELDVLRGFAETAVRRGWTRPHLIAEPGLNIVGGRHPVLDDLLGDGFVPNDCQLGPQADDPAPAGGGEAESNFAPAATAAPHLALITGPNMAGKSTYIRQVALITLLAHTGSWVPAEAATIGRTDRIFTRIGAADELHAGQSTFMVEMVETASILHHATEHSLVILDEIGRGTSTLDGLALAWAIAETIDDRGCRALFATHYHELTELPETRPGVCNLHVTVREWEGDVIFLHRIAAGRAGQSYGIHVARIAGLPRATVQRASAVLDSLVVQTHAPRSPADGQLGLFAAAEPAPANPASKPAPEPAPETATATAAASSPEPAAALPHPVIETVRGLDLDRMTPMDAFDALRNLRAAAAVDADAPPAGA
ncbi:MAG: DNA mismatch repair protein MutS [Phycisphaerales bacterium]